MAYDMMSGGVEGLGCGSMVMWRHCIMGVGKHGSRGHGDIRCGVVCGSVDLWGYGDMGI